jgi:hypothetical protein
MKMRCTYYPFIIMVVLILLISSCRKDDSNGEAQLPAITTGTPLIQISFVLMAGMYLRILTGRKWQIILVAIYWPVEN